MGELLIGWQNRKDTQCVRGELIAGHAGAGYANALLDGKVLPRDCPGGRLCSLGNQPAACSSIGVFPEVVIIKAGANDLVLPWFRMRGGLRRGAGPLSSAPAPHAAQSNTTGGRPMLDAPKAARKERSAAGADRAAGAVFGPKV